MSWADWPEYGGSLNCSYTRTEQILHQKEYIFCFENCFDRLCEKNVFKFEAEGRDFSKILRAL